MALLGPVLLLYLAFMAYFASVQNLWLDETTQLSGILLSPFDQILWLAGKLHPHFGVPDDRMPPVSYLVDWLGWLVWGSNILAFRLYHGVIVGIGIAALSVACGRRFGTRTGLFAALFLIFAPKLVEVAVEIRAYPLFLAISCLQMAMLVRGDVAARPARLARFALLALLSGYTHFFGIVASSAFFLAAFIAAPDLRAFIRAVATYGLLLILWGGLAPFIFGATANSNTALVSDSGLSALLLYAVRLFGTSAQMVSLPASLLYLGGLALLGVIAALGILGRIARQRLDARLDPLVGTLVALLAGVAVCMLASFVVKGFNVLAPRYSVWTLAPSAVLFAAAADGLLAPAGRAMQRLRFVALALVAVGAVWSQAQFLGRAQWFVHGPSTTLEARLAEAGSDTAIVYEGPAWVWGYMPFYYRHGDALPQWLLTPDGGQVIRVGKGGVVTSAPQPLRALARYKTLLVARIDLRTYEDLRALAADPATRAFAVPDLAPGLTQSGWRDEATFFKPGFYALTGRTFRNPSNVSTPEE